MSLVATAMLCPGTVRECAGCSKSAAASPRGNSGVDPFTRRDLKPCVLEVLKNYAQSIGGTLFLPRSAATTVWHSAMESGLSMIKSCCRSQGLKYNMVLLVQ